MGFNEQSELSSRKGDFGGLPDDDEEEEENLEDETLKDDAIFLVHFAVPFALSNVGFTVSGIIALAFIGSLGTSELAAVSYAQIWMNFSIMMLFVPTAAALESLVSQAVGAGSKVLTGVWLQISLICSIGLTIPIAITWVFIGPFLALIGASDSNEAHARYARDYAVWSIPSLPALVAYTVVEAWFQSMEIVLPSAFCTSAALLSTVGFNALFLFVFEWGVIGAALATVGSAWVQFGSYLFMVLVVSKSHREFWSGWHWDKLCKKKRWKEYLFKQLLPQFGGTALDEVHNMVISAVAVTFGPNAITAHNITFQAVCLVFVIPMAIMIATGVRIGNYLGANLPQFGRRMSHFSIVATTVVGALLGLLYYFMRRVFARLILGGDANGPAIPKIIRIVDDIGWPTAVNIFAYSVMSSGLGTLDGQARPYTVGLVMAFGGWLVSVPLAWMFRYAAEDYGLRGTWWAEAAGYAVAAVLVLIIVFQSDWKYQAKLAIKRAEEEDEAEKQAIEDDSDMEGDDSSSGQEANSVEDEDDADESTGLASRAYLKKSLQTAT